MNPNEQYPEWKQDKRNRLTFEQTIEAAKDIYNTVKDERDKKYHDRSYPREFPEWWALARTRLISPCQCASADSKAPNNAYTNDPDFWNIRVILRALFGLDFISPASRHGRKHWLGPADQRVHQLERFRDGWDTTIENAEERAAKALPTSKRILNNKRRRA